MELFILIILLFFIIAPICLLFHEMGHVIGARIMHATSIRLTIGIGKVIWQFPFQNIQIIVRKLFIINSFTATVRDEPFRNHEKIFISLMGPLFNLILAIIFYFLHRILIPYHVIYITFLFNIWLTFINLIPFKIGKKQSDGYTIIQQIVKKTR